MIPHHAIAILTNEHAVIADLRVCELANGIIIRSSVRRSPRMDWLVDDIAANGDAATQAETDARPVPTFSGDTVRETAGR